VETGLTLLGLVALLDPPRPEAAEAVRLCQAAGITPVMITGDHPATAKAMAVRLGIAQATDGVLTGQDLAKTSAADLQNVIRETRVYARVTPAQKITLVQALQEGGEFVAMTGDGVNDAPALKRADIGVAMGRQGTDVAREAADMVLLDDHFATLVAAVREGRRIYDNICKFLKYIMACNAGEIWTLLLAPLLGLPLPLLPIQILWINLVTDGLPGLALAAEPQERGIMQRPPRPPQESVFAHGLWQHTLWFGLLIGGLALGAQAWAWHHGSPNWQTVTFTVLTLAQLVQALAIRSERDSLFTIGIGSNRPLLGAVLLTLLLQLAVIYLPWGHAVLKTSPLTLQELAVCLLLPWVVLVAVEIEKGLARRGWIYATTDKRSRW
jgi:Ca2+-transporting ATPase